jgi:hypothetical protein
VTLTAAAYVLLQELQLRADRTSLARAPSRTPAARAAEDRRTRHALRPPIRAAFATRSSRPTRLAGHRGQLRRQSPLIEDRSSPSPQPTCGRAATILAQQPVPNALQHGTSSSSRHIRMSRAVTLAHASNGGLSISSDE